MAGIEVTNIIILEITYQHINQGSTLSEADRPFVSEVVLAASVGEGPRPRNSETAKRTRKSRACASLSDIY
ncbi:hypothetical protein FRC12_018135 [Ceratobasidium sp. 428]|nr:hypothetical protein FRC12_018135 [Ceratobasidium sp. 428]